MINRHHLCIGGTILIVIQSLSVSLRAQSDEMPPVSDATQTCLDCHTSLNPGIVEDWKRSRHAIVTPGEALAKPELERRISSDSIPDELRAIAVGCYECHSLNAEQHTDNFEHFGYNINIIVSPNDCRTCHPTEADEYAGSKKAHALGNLEKNALFNNLIETITSTKEIVDGEIVQLRSSHIARHETCYGCHGTEVEVAGTRTIGTDLGEIDVPVLTNWPNQGVGRVNPDGSLGACTACHPRHSFSIEVARKPYTCSQCHLEPDLPAWDVYRESKHGNIFQSEGDDWNWDAVPWTVGEDFKAPTCATCHNSLLVNTEGDVIVERSHTFDNRLWVRIFGLLYSHPQPKYGETHLIENSDGQPLPTTFDGDIAHEYLIDSTEQAVRRSRMQAVCTSCHGPSWAKGHFDKLDSTLAETDMMVRAATDLMRTAWDEGLADPENPFDEKLEQLWITQWLFYANSVRYASAMSGPDYATFKNGWWYLTKTLRDMHAQIGVKRELKK